MRSKLSLPLLNAHQTAKKLVSHPNFHGGSIETTDSNNIIELNNFSEFGPKKASGDFGSVDSSEFLGTWAFPSQGSLANIELLAAQGSMGPNGSINNSVYVNPFEPGRDVRRRQVFRESPGSPRRRKRMSSRSRSTDLAELDGTRETSLREGRGPKHKGHGEIRVRGWWMWRSIVSRGRTAPPTCPQTCQQQQLQLMRTCRQKLRPP